MIASQREILKLITRTRHELIKDIKKNKIKPN